MLGSLVDWESVFRSSVSAVCVWLLLDTRVQRTVIQRSADKWGPESVRVWCYQTS